MSRKRLEQFKVDIVGPKPEDVGFGELADFVRALEQAVLAAGAVTDSALKLSLVGIEEGSDRLTLALPTEATTNISVLTAALANQDYSSLPRAAHQALSDMSKVTKRNNWGFRFVGDRNLNIARVEVPVGVDIPAPVVQTIRGATSVLAQCMRVGGAVTPRAELRLANRQPLLHVDITEALAKRLATRLYEDVVLSGEAQWDSATWEILSFAVTSLSEYEPVPVDVSFRGLAEAAGGAWDQIDGEEFVRGQRGERSD